MAIDSDAPAPPIPTGAWRCQEWIGDRRSLNDPDRRPCKRCGTELAHPSDVCCDPECGHLVVFHGADTEGCGRIWAAGWCDCRCTFGREHADYVRYG